MELKVYPPAPVCAECKGECCRQAPGAVYPVRVVPPMVETLAKMLRSEKYCVDWWEGDPRPGEEDAGDGFFIRPAIKGFEGELYHPSWGGECTFLKGNGCGLSDEARPLGCRTLQPALDRRCSQHCEPYQNDKQRAAIAWWPHRHIIVAACEAVKGQQPCE